MKIFIVFFVLSCIIQTTFADVRALLACEGFNRNICARSLSENPAFIDVRVNPKTVLLSYKDCDTVVAAVSQLPGCHKCTSLVLRNTFFYCFGVQNPGINFVG